MLGFMVMDAQTENAQLPAPCLTGTPLSHVVVDLAITGSLKGFVDYDAAKKTKGK